MGIVNERTGPVHDRNRLGRRSTRHGRQGQVMAALTVSPQRVSVSVLVAV